MLGAATLPQRPSRIVNESLQNLAKKVLRLDEQGGADVDIELVARVNRRAALGSANRRRQGSRDGTIYHVASPKPNGTSTVLDELFQTQYSQVPPACLRRSMRCALHNSKARGEPFDVVGIYSTAGADAHLGSRPRSCARTAAYDGLFAQTDHGEA